MSSNPADDQTTGREPTIAERAATLWVARCDAGLTATQQVDFERWLAEDPRHAELFSEYEGAWALFDRVRESPRAVTSDVRLAPFLPPALDAEGARPELSPIFVLRRHVASLWVAASLAAAAVLACGYIGWWRPIHFTTAVASQIGNLQRMPLPDGSLIELNTDSAVSVLYSLRERRVRLERGEAHFTVASDPERPFTVVANGVAVRAVGTAFNVRLSAAAIEVLVTAGSVRVADATKGESLLPKSADWTEESPSTHEAKRVLSAGQRVVITAPSLTVVAPAPGILTVVAASELQRELAWQQHRLEFVSASLGEIVAEFNRYNRHKLVVVDEQLSAKRFGGSFQANDPARFVRMLRDEFSVLVEERGDKTILKGAR